MKKEHETLEKGKIKVVWASKDGKQLHSKMFDTISDAETFGAAKKDYIMFQLTSQKHMNEFTWNILPYGKHTYYKAFLTAYRKGAPHFLHLTDTFPRITKTVKKNIKKLTK